MKKISLGVICLFSVLLIMTGLASAENRSGAITLSPHIGVFVFDSEQDINTDPLYGLGIGYNFTEHWAIEAVFDYVNTDLKEVSKDTDVDSSLFKIDGLYHFMPEEEFVPYVAAGFGAIDIDTENVGSESNSMFNYGAGVKYFITESLAARADVRHLYEFDDHNNDFTFTLGLTMNFGGKAKIIPPGDADGDGVNDDLDRCPDTPAGVAVDSNGCPLDTDGDGVYDYLDKCPGTPAGIVVDSNGCPLDSDGDGVYDYLDRCPDTPAGVVVDSNGCPLDSDGDGVYDYLDECPDTPAGIKVDAKGCPIPIKEKVSIELSVEFEFDRADVKSVYGGHIQKVANFLKAYPKTMAEIAGHTDSKGSEQYNLKLSQKRAEQVVEHMVSQGIDAKRLKAVGHGESIPIADNATEAGRQKNRRVVAVIATIITK